jgi:hypothetical protein
VMVQMIRLKLKMIVVLVVRVRFNWYILKFQKIRYW